LRLEYSSDRVKIIPKNNLEAKLQKDKINYYLVNDTINIELDSCFDGLAIIETYKEDIQEFEILRGDMDDVFVNITGRKLGGE